MEGFLDLNSSPQYYPGCFEESLKQSMINREIILKKSLLMKGEVSAMKRTFTGYFRDGDDDYVDLSLRLGRNTNKSRRIGGKSSKNKIVYPLSCEIIDLEGDSGIGSSDDVRPVFSVDQSSRKSTINLEKYPSHGTIKWLVNGGNSHGDHLKVEPSSRTVECLMNGDMHHERRSFNQGSNELHDVKKTKIMDFDLNEDQPDESSFQSNEPLGPYQSSDGSCSESFPPKDQIKTHIINLESEPSSDLTEENEINVSEVIEEKVKNDSDYAIEKAAHSLVSISMQQSSTSNRDSQSKSASNEIENKIEIKNEEKKIIRRRSSSIDSYESLVLKLEESSVDEDSATSNVIEIEEIDRKENGIQLRRGRRMKDFQKDILPTLSTLTRHEIWEDIKILEGVIRSREYKRLQKGKMENWFPSVKSKRSKVNYVGQSRKKK